MTRILTVGIAFAATLATAAPFSPDLSKAVLHVGQKELHPVRILPGGADGEPIDGLLVGSRSNSLAARRLGDGGEAWKTAPPGGSYPELIAHRPGLGFVRFWQKQTTDGYDSYRPEPSGQVGRVCLSDGRWLEPLTAGPSSTNKIVQILQVLPASNCVFVLDCVPGESDLHEMQIKSYRLSCFAADSTRPKWQREFKSAGTVPSYGAGILFQGDPNYAKSAIRHLSIFGSTLIVCAGAVEDILALDAESGAERWRLPAVWEFQRGFIGPSVWQHFIARFGIDRLPDEKNISDRRYRNEVRATKKRMEEMRKELASQCRIVGGPIAVPTPKSMPTRYCERHAPGEGKPDPEPFRLFVAVSKDDGKYGGYLAQCAIYEIGEDGKPMALVQMPRMVVGSECLVRDGCALWRCEHGALAAMRPSRQTRGIGMGGQGTDCIANLAWFLQPPDDPGEPDEDDLFTGMTNWLVCAKGAEAMCLSDDAIYRRTGGLIVRHRGDRAGSFPLRRTSFPEGRTADMTLSVPFSGDLKLPTKIGAFSKDCTYAYEPVGMTVERLAILQDCLVVSVCVEAQAPATLLFSESDIREAAATGK